MSTTTGFDAGLWNDGYVVDVAYHEPFFGDLCPAWLSMCTVLHGQPPLDRSRPLSWIELGSGSGLSACTVAAANPGVHVWGCDFNPAHVERARAFASKAGLAELCTFTEASFADVATIERLGPPEADVIVVNGVYSWISRVNQRHIAAIVQRRLRPGGLVLMSYGLAAGWSAMTPLAEAMHLHARASGRRSDVAYPEAAAALTRLAEAGAPACSLPPREADAFAQLTAHDPQYAAHEFLGAHFRPLMFAEVADTMAAARCTYVGSVDATDHLVHLWAPEALQALLADIEDPIELQMLRDLVTQRPLRRDVFRRGLAPVNPVQRGEWLRELVVVGSGHGLPEVATVPVPLGSVTLDPTYYEPLVARLAEGTLDVDGILAVHAEFSFDEAVTALALLVSGGYAIPQVRDWGDGHTRERTRRFNRVLIDENRRGAAHEWLASPVTGGPVASEYTETLTVGALAEGKAPDPDELTSYVLAEIAFQGRLVREENGEVVDDPDRAKGIVRDRVTRALERARGALQRLAIVGALRER
jgi:predicted O-methyltransferase YrrM